MWSKNGLNQFGPKVVCSKEGSWQQTRIEVAFEFDHYNWPSSSSLVAESDAEIDPSNYCYWMWLLLPTENHHNWNRHFEGRRWPMLLPGFVADAADIVGIFAVVVVDYIHYFVVVFVLVVADPFHCLHILHPHSPSLIVVVDFFDGIEVVVVVEFVGSSMPLLPVVVAIVVGD